MCGWGVNKVRFSCQIDNVGEITRSDTILHDIARQEEKKSVHINYNFRQGDILQLYTEYILYHIRM